MIAFAYFQTPDGDAEVCPTVLEITETSLVIKSGGAMVDLPLEYVYQALKENDERRRKCKD